MSSSVAKAQQVPWWKEPTKDQWIAWWAAWLGWTLDAFDFTIFLLIMVPIAKEFNVPLTEVTARLHPDACGCGWSARRRRAGWPIGSGRKTPLMISILWYSICNFIAGFSPTFGFLLFFRALLGIGMGAEWPAGAALAMEHWPVRSRGFMSGVLQGSWGIGFLLSSADLRPVLRLHRLARHAVDRRPAGAGRSSGSATTSKSRRSGLENRRKQREQKREVRAPLVAIFQRGMHRQHAPGVLVDGEQLRHLLLDLGAVRDASAEGSGPRPRWSALPFMVANLSASSPCASGAGSATSSAGAGR